jgi:hypothetical protein
MKTLTVAATLALASTACALSAADYDKWQKDHPIVYTIADDTLRSLREGDCLIARSGSVEKVECIETCKEERK